MLGCLPYRSAGVTVSSTIDGFIEQRGAVTTAGTHGFKRRRNEMARIGRVPRSTHGNGSLLGPEPTVASAGSRRVGGPQRRVKNAATIHASTNGVDEHIRVRAYYLFLEREPNAGGPLDDWLRAEREVAARAEGR